MARPLYPSSQTAQLGRDGHAGLWYDKFCDAWNPGFEKLGDAKTAGDKEIIKEAAQRQCDLAQSHGLSVLIMKTEGPFVTGLGREHPVENGFTWHPTLGTPYLPGSSVKGLVRSWATQWCGAESEAKRILGDKDQVGTVIFLDALPLGHVALTADVMTPHYGDYIQKGETPGDWMKPNPVPFLAVAKGQRFQFAVLPQGSNPKHLDDCRTALNWLKEALDMLGAGAKTAAGYGRMAISEADQTRMQQESEKRQQALEKQRQIAKETAGLSPLAAELVAESKRAGWEASNDAFFNGWRAWNDRLKGEPDPQAVAKLLELVRKIKPDLLANPDAVEGKKNKPSFKEAQRQLAKDLLALERQLLG